MTENEIIIYLIALILGYLFCRYMGDGFSVDKYDKKTIIDIIKKSNSYECVTTGIGSCDPKNYSCKIGESMITIMNNETGICQNLCLPDIAVSAAKSIDLSPLFLYDDGISCVERGYSKCKETCEVRNIPKIGTLKVTKYTENLDNICGRPNLCSNIDINDKDKSSEERCLGTLSAITNDVNCVIETDKAGNDLCIPGTKKCSNEMPQSKCSEIYCSNHGNCIGERVTPFKGTCSCNSKYFGKKCSQKCSSDGEKCQVIPGSADQCCSGKCRLAMGQGHWGICSPF